MTSGGELVQQMRAVAQLSQSELARRAGISQSAVSDYERGVKVPSLPTLERLARAADVVLNIDVVPRTNGMVNPMRRVQQHREDIKRICGNHGAHNPRLVGSVAQGTAHAESDIDIVVDLEPGRTLFDVAALHDELAELLSTEVDVITSGAIRGALSNILNDAISL